MSILPDSVENFFDGAAEAVRSFADIAGERVAEVDANVAAVDAITVNVIGLEPYREQKAAQLPVNMAEQPNPERSASVTDLGAFRRRREAEQLVATAQQNSATAQSDMTPVPPAPEVPTIVAEPTPISEHDAYIAKLVQHAHAVHDEIERQAA